MAASEKELTRARATLWAIACGQVARLTNDEAGALWALLNDLERNQGQLRRRIEAATKDLHAQADRLVAQVVGEEQRANRLQKELDAWKARA